MKATHKFLRRLVLVAGLLSASSLWAALPIQHWTAANGARIYLVESPSLPMVDIQIDFDAGSRRDPAGQAGLASATAGMLSKALPPTAISLHWTRTPCVKPGPIWAPCFLPAPAVTA